MLSPRQNGHIRIPKVTVQRLCRRRIDILRLIAANFPNTWGAPPPDYVGTILPHGLFKFVHFRPPRHLLARGRWSSTERPSFLCLLFLMRRL